MNTTQRVRVSIKPVLLIIISVMVFTFSCREDIDDSPSINEPQSKKLSANEIPGLLNAIAPYVNPSLSERGDISSSNQGDTFFGMSIDLEEILMRMDSAGFTNYAMLLEDNDFNSRTFSNLVIGKDENGEFKPPLLMRYEMTEEFAQQYYKTGSLEGFQGIIRKAELLPLDTETQRLSRTTGGSEDPSDYGSDRDQPNTTCEEETVFNGNDTSTSPTPSGYSLTMEICEKIVNYGYTYDSQGNRVPFMYFTYENCHTVEVEMSSSDTGTCSTPTGEIPVNDPGPLKDIKDTIDMDDLPECLQEIINKVLNNNSSKAKLDEILQQFASDNPNFNWKLKVGTLDGDAKTLNSYDRSTGTVTTIFSLAKAQSASELSWAMTFMHESIHAYVTALSRVDRGGTVKEFSEMVEDLKDQLFAGDLEALQHQEMARNWIGRLETALKSYGVSQGYQLSDQYYADMAWGGLTQMPDGTGGWQWAPWFADLYPNISDRNRIQNTLEIEARSQNLSGNYQRPAGGETGCD